ncbi:sensor histidine kinase [Spirulina major]|uniref:sensor histidine kinase n=1 Tax=Spirulina major TaxID=270636 RepID=UPI000933B563|nr:HAMP domain-containing sensor histidine kinase [Spirulina major]
MSLVLVFVLGLCTGLLINAWQQYRFAQQVEQLLQILPVALQDTSSLAPLYRLRRSLHRLLETQQTSQQQGQLWTKILEVAPIGYLRVDAINQLLWCNPIARQTLNIDRWQPGQVRLLLELVRSYELDQLIETTRATGQSQDQEWIYRSTTVAKEDWAVPTPYAIALRASTLLLPDNHVGVFLENRQSIQEALQARDRAFSDLTHELRTPLTSIQLVAETLLRRLDLPEKQWVEQMLRELKRLMDLIQSCLDLSRLTSHPDQLLHCRSVRVTTLILTAWQTLVPIAEQKKLRLCYHGSAELELEVDVERFIQVLLNILDNAIKHSPEGGEILVALNTPGPDSDLANWHTIDVIDSGPGFREDEIPFIFERLYRGDTSRQRLETHPQIKSPLTNSGSGLGLAIVQQIVIAHGGLVTAQNHPHTGGAWLQIQLPNIH